MDKKSKWIDKMKNSNSIVWIDNSKETGESPVLVAEKLWDMYDDDFNLTISDICGILLCGRNWVIDNVKNNVKHIFIGMNMRKFMTNVDAYNRILKDYYYFSRQDFCRWLNENTIVQKQTVVVDVSKYSKNINVLRNIITKYDKDIGSANSMLEIAAINLTYNNNVYNNLNDMGKKLFSLKARSDKRVGEFITIPYTIPESFVSIKELRDVFVNNERVYRSLYERGAIKYTICNSLVRFDKNYINTHDTNGELDIIVPYCEYINMLFIIVT